MNFALIMTIVLLIELFYSPRIEKTSAGDVLLFYGKTYRKYFKIWKL